MSDDLLPCNSTPLERSLSSVISRTSSIPVVVKQVWNPSTCPASILPWLAWALDISNWDSTWTEGVKRAAIAASISVHRHAGTIGALKSALLSLGYAVTVQEYVSGPYTFSLSIDASSGGTIPIEFDEIEAVALQVKNVRSQLTGITVFLNSSGNLLYEGSFNVSGEATSIYPAVTTYLEGDAPRFEAGAALIKDTISVFPS